MRQKEMKIALHQILRISLLEQYPKCKSKKNGKDLETIQPGTTPAAGYQMGK